MKSEIRWPKSKGEIGAPGLAIGSSPSSILRTPSPPGRRRRGGAAGQIACASGCSRGFSSGQKRTGIRCRRGSGPKWPFYLLQNLRKPLQTGLWSTLVNPIILKQRREKQSRRWKIEDGGNQKGKGGNIQHETFNAQHRRHGPASKTVASQVCRPTKRWPTQVGGHRTGGAGGFAEQALARDISNGPMSNRR